MTKKTAAAPYDPDQRYAVTLKKPITASGRRLDPRHGHTLRGDVANEHADAIETATRVVKG